MKYLMLVCWDSESMDAQTEPDPTDTPDEETFPWLDDLQARGGWITGDQLAPPRRARSVRVRDGKAIVTDGPFAETKEAVGGFDVVECGSLEEAVEIAAGHPVAQTGTIEVPAALGELTGASCSGHRSRGSRLVQTQLLRGEELAAFVITRIQTGDYDRWRPMFDRDQPRAREKAQTQRVLRSVDDPNEVFIYLEFSSLEDANEARERLVSSGVLDRFADKHGPNVLSDAG